MIEIKAKSIDSKTGEIESKINGKGEEILAESLQVFNALLEAMDGTIIKDLFILAVLARIEKEA